ncbi:fumarylacetoacetate hydrolase family protein [Nocardioides immobilis]|uniref:Fumarylacetoacetate hydrolase family protein n=1 Tax=Nocardioides immobilis TaxID=2049295 RepID=A0A417XUW6_9ACTN|nr:fumarylacetoacetate hydrolase family protein [Nocardioides immobilis]RHW24071.1 fumarylacetoacetate hydrolase family protein [Nocardioides immobilis]
MKLARYEHNGAVLLGTVRHDMVRSLPRNLDVLDVLTMSLPERNLLEAQAGRHHRIPLDDVRFVPPIEPRAMRDFVVFEEHVRGVTQSVAGTAEIAEAWYDAPAFIFMNPHSLISHRQDVPMPPDTQALDFELEVAAVVGSKVRDLTVDQAAEHIVGYAVFNDWSARDIQRREMQVSLGPAKGKDFASTLGPWITTPDELEPYRVGDRYNLTMTVSVNDTEIGRDSLANMAWSFEEMLSHASRDAWVGAGDVLATGTCAGGALAEMWGRRGVMEPPPLQVGDVVTMAVDGLGSISNRVTQTRSPGHRVPPARSPAAGPVG